MSVRATTPVRVLTALAFQVQWLALVWSAGHAWSAVVCGGTVALVALELRLAGDRMGASLLYLLAAVAAGGAMDTALTAAGVLIPLRVAMPPPLPPLWLVGLWVAFAGFLRVVLTYLQGRPTAQWLVGAVGGPVAYWSGSRMGAIGFGIALPAALSVLGVLWGCMCVALFWLDARIGRASDGTASPWLPRRREPDGKGDL